MFVPLYGGSETLSLRVTSQDGTALSGTAWVDDDTIKFNDGEFKIDLPKRSYRQVRLEVTGYYPAFHTLWSPDWQSRRVPTIRLVDRRPERRLLILTGDAMVGRRFLAPLPGDATLVDVMHQQRDMKKLLVTIAPYFRLGDLVSVNLETQLLRGELPPKLAKSVVFHTDPVFLDVLAEAGVDYVALGNNHIYDYGEEGLERTLAALARSKLHFSGAGRNTAEARRAARSQGWSLLSYVGWPGSAAADQVARANKGGAAWGRREWISQDVQRQTLPTLVQYHGGLEYSEAPTLIERTRFYSAVEAGADLVVGHHPHVLQGLEWYKDRLIAYSLGNFLFDQYIYSTQLSMLLYVWMDEEALHRVEVVPIYINGYQPTPAVGAIRFDVLQRVVQMSSGLNFAMSGAHVYAKPSPKVIPKGQAVTVLDLAPTEYPQPLWGLISPVQKEVEIETTATNVRFGVDLVKRGTFDYWGLFDTQPLNWLTSAGVDYESTDNPYLQVTGSALTGLRSFERQFTRSNPATVSATFNGSCQAEVEFLLQRRNLTQALSEALAQGQKISLGRHIIHPQLKQTVYNDFNLPRINTKGVRLLIEVRQAPGCQLAVDDVSLVEWRTPWLSTNSIHRLSTPTTHLQLSRPKVN